jgi:hypothetical protein
MPPESSTLSFRADSRDVDELKKLAEQGRISTNALMSQILKSYLEWEHIASRVGMVPVQKETVGELINSKPDEELKKIAVRAADKFMDKLLVITGKSSLDAYLRVTGIRLEKSGFTFRIFDADGSVQLIVQHGMARCWSVFFSAYHERVVNNLGYQTRIEIMDDSWIMWIGPKQG